MYMEENHVLLYYSHVSMHCTPIAQITLYSQNFKKFAFDCFYPIPLYAKRDAL